MTSRSLNEEMRSETSVDKLSCGVTLGIHMLCRGSYSSSSSLVEPVQPVSEFGKVQQYPLLQSNRNTVSGVLVDLSLFICELHT
jgi:hypothetical protein